MSTSILPDDEYPLAARKGKTQSVRRSVIGSRATVARTVRGVPEVLIKISSSGKDMRAIAASVEYISRHGLVALEDERGDVFVGEHARSEALSDWRGVPKVQGGRRESFHIVFSMPNQTDREAVTESVRRFASETFRGHQYLFATHNDTDRPHVHLLVKATPYQGLKRLNPRKGDLQLWREVFAEHLRSLGVEANATPRAARGVSRYSRSQGAIEFDKKRGVFVRTTTEPKPKNMPNLMAQRDQVLSEYALMVEALSKGSADDLKLAADIKHYVLTLDPIGPALSSRSEPEVSRGPEL